MASAERVTYATLAAGQTEEFRRKFDQAVERALAGIGGSTKRRCPPSWARLISKVFHADPLVCGQCGGKLKVIAYVSDEISVKRILAEWGLSPPEEDNPPPIREVARVPVDDLGHEFQAG